MRGPYSPAIWLFAALACGLLAVGARAPRPRLSPAAQAARQQLLERARSQTPPQETRLCPERGCLLDRSTGAIYRRNELGEWAAHGSTGAEPALGVCVVVTPAWDAADPSARDYALAELSAALRAQWQRQAGQTPVPGSYGFPVFVLAEESSVPHSRNWAAAFNQWRDVAAKMCGRFAREVESWSAIVSRLMPLEPEPDLAPAAQLAPAGYEPLEREERSVLVRRNPAIVENELSDELPNLAEREEQSVLIRR